MTYQVSGSLTTLSIFALFAIVAFQNERIIKLEDKVKAIEKVLKGGKYLCSVKRKIKSTHINCDLLKNTQEQDN